MSIGNLKDSGNQGNNFPWQLKVLQGLQGILNGSGDVIDIIKPEPRIPHFIRVTGPGTIAVEVYSLSVSNVGLAPGYFLGTDIKPGETLNFNADALNNYYAANAFTYDGTDTELIIIYNT